MADACVGDMSRLPDGALACANDSISLTAQSQGRAVLIPAFEFSVPGSYSKHI